MPSIPAHSTVTFVRRASLARTLRPEAVMDHQFIGEVAALSHFDRVNFANQFWRGDVRGGEFFTVAVFPGQPGNRCIITLLTD
jgi:hypothetical protein